MYKSCACTTIYLHIYVYKKHKHVNNISHADVYVSHYVHDYMTVNMYDGPAYWGLPVVPAAFSLNMFEPKPLWVHFRQRTIAE